MYDAREMRPADEIAPSRPPRRISVVLRRVYILMDIGGFTALHRHHLRQIGRSSRHTVCAGRLASGANYDAVIEAPRHQSAARAGQKREELRTSRRQHCSDGFAEGGATRAGSHHRHPFMPQRDGRDSLLYVSER